MNAWDVMVLRHVVEAAMVAVVVAMQQSGRGW